MSDENTEPDYYNQLKFASSIYYHDSFVLNNSNKKFKSAKKYS